MRVHGLQQRHDDVEELGGRHPLQTIPQPVHAVSIGAQRVAHFFPILHLQDTISDQLIDKLVVTWLHDTFEVIQEVYEQVLLPCKGDCQSIQPIKLRKKKCKKKASHREQLLSNQ